MGRGGSKGRKKPSLYGLSKQPLRLEHKEAFAKELMGESDRAAALVAAAEVESYLVHLLMFKFTRLGKEERDAVFFGRDAPLSAFADRISIAYGLGIIHADERDDLDSIRRIRNAFALQGSSCGLENLPALADKILAFVDPLASAAEQAVTEADGAGAKSSNKEGTAAGAAPASLTQARDALAAIADYYSRLEPSSPTLPLVRQAHQLIGKSFIEVMNILVPTQMEKAAFQIGAEQVFELPVGRLSKLSETAPVAADQPSGAVPPGGAGASGYSVQSRSQAIALLDQVQRFFRAAEPSSPVPMLCERARALAERDFMGVLRDVLPKAALKNAGADK